MELTHDDVTGIVKAQLDQLPEFWGRTWRKGTALYRSAWTAGLVPTLSELDDVLAYSLLRYPFVSMYAGGLSVPAGAFTSTRVAGDAEHIGYFDYGKAMDLFDEGTALELGAMNQWHRSTSLVAAALGELLDAHVDAQVFITPPGVQGVPVHRDRADGLAIQLAGAKHWRLYAPPTDPHWRTSMDDGPGELEHEFVTRPGDVLYIVTGAAHEVRAAPAQPSAHVTFGIRYVDGPSMVERIGAEVSRRLGGPDVLAASLTGREADLRTAVATTGTVTAEWLISDSRRALQAKNYRPRAGRITIGDW